MSRFAIFAAPAPAAIDRIVTIPPGEDVAAQLAEGEAALAVAEEVLVTTHRIAAGPAAEAIPPAAPTEAQLLRALKRLRDAARATAPVTLEIGGESVALTIDTAPEDIAALTGLVVAAGAGLATEPFAFKGGGAFFDLTAAQLLSVARAAREGVQRAYDAERAVRPFVLDGTIAGEAALDSAFAAALEA